MGFSEERRFNQSSLHTVYREGFLAKSRSKRKREQRGMLGMILNKCSHSLIDLFVVVSGFLLTEPFQNKHC